MAIYKNWENSNRSLPCPVVQDAHDKPELPVLHECIVSDLRDLDQALTFAAMYHMGACPLDDEQLCSLVKKLKQLAANELELGDGRKVESVRVERKMDGSVSIFFGI